jgi:S-layer protein
MLTTSVDDLTGGAGNDTVTAILGQSGEDSATWTKLDSIDGGAGSDTMNVLDLGTSAYDNNIYYNTGHEIPAGTIVTSVETINIRAAYDVGFIAGQNIESFDVSGFTGLTRLNVTQAVNVNVTAGDDTAVSVAGTTGSVTLAGGASQTVTSGTTVTASGSVGAVTVSGVTGNIDIDDGTSVTVTDAKANTNITIGHNEAPTGAIIVTDSNLGTGNITIDGGDAVTVTASKVAGGLVTIGGKSAPAGAVTVTTTGVAYDPTAAHVLADITIDGGTSVTVDQTATSSSAEALTSGTNKNHSATQGNVLITGGSETTSVTVVQDAEVAAVNAVEAVAAVNEVQTITFVELAAGDTFDVDGLTFTASKSLTAAQVAAAFANLSAGADGGSAPASNGTYSGALSSNWASGAVATSGSGNATVYKVSLTATVDDDQVDIVANKTISSSSSKITPTETTKGVDGIKAVDGVMGILAGKVTINGDLGQDGDVLTTVTLDGYGAGSTVISDALTTLTLANSVNDLTVTNAKATTLALNVNNVVQDALALDLDNGGTDKTYTTLNITTSGKDSTVNLTADKVATLTVAGDKALDLSGATLGALKTVTVSGAAGLTLDASGANVTAVSTAATTGNSTITVDADKATFTGGSGRDTVTLSTTTVDQDVSLGGGDDSLTLAAGTTAVSSTLSGGLGTDTLAMDAADADAVSGSTTFGAKIDGFEKLSLGQAAAASTLAVDLANLDGISYVVSANAAAAVTIPEPDSTNLNIINVTGGMNATLELTFGGGMFNNQNTVLIDGQAIEIDGVTFTATGDVGATDLVSAMVAVLNGGNVPNGTSLTATGSASGNYGATSSFGNTLVMSDLAQNPSTPWGLVFDQNLNFLPDFLQGSNIPAGDLTLDNMTNGGTLELTDGGAGVTVTMEDAAGAADSFNIVTKVVSGDLDFGTVTVEDVETVNITATDTKTTANLATLELVGDAKTVVVTGNGHLDLTAAISALKTVDASALTGDFTFTSDVNSATVTGGSGDDLITGTGNSQILTGGLGDDTLVVTGNLARLTGGAGEDVFDVGAATSTVNSYATITDLAAGDAIKLSSAALEFVSSAVALADTAAFQDYANAAIAATGDGAVSWFQFAGNTYVVENVDVDNNPTTADAGEVTFTNGQDIVVRITGLVDLSTSAFNTTQNALLVV